MLLNHCPAKKIHSVVELEGSVNSLVEMIQEVLKQKVSVTKPSPYMKRWWSKELTRLKKEKNKLSKISYKFRGMTDHPPYAEHRSAANGLHSCIDEL